MVAAGTGEAGSRRSEVLQSFVSLEPLPDVVVRTMGLLNRRDTEPAQIEDVLRGDPALVAKLLSVVNTPFYALSREITTIADAVMMMGFAGLRSLLMSSSVAPYCAVDIAALGHGKNGLWKHSIAVAAVAREIAARTGLGPREREELFVAGLLHDIGKMVTGPHLRGVEVPAIYRDDVAMFERELLGVDHAEVGGLIAESWQMGPALVGVLREHHERDGVDPRLATVRLADAVAHATGTGFAAGLAPAGDIAVADLATLGIDQQAWQAWQEELHDSVDIAVASLGSL